MVGATWRIDNNYYHNKHSSILSNGLFFEEEILPLGFLSFKGAKKIQTIENEESFRRTIIRLIESIELHLFESSICTRNDIPIVHFRVAGKIHEIRNLFDCEYKRIKKNR